MTLPPFTQSFVVTLATDGDVTAKELTECLQALGYHTREVLTCHLDHEHPCPTADMCIRSLRGQGYAVPDGTGCCVCWMRENAADDLDRP